MALFLRFEVTIKDVSGYPHSQYHYYDDLADCRNDRNRYIKELDETATIGPIQQAITVWKDFEGTYEPGKSGVVQSKNGVLPDEPFADNEPEFDTDAFTTNVSRGGTATTARNYMEEPDHE